MTRPAEHDNDWLAWLGAPDGRIQRYLADFTRAALRSHAYDEDGVALAVHINRIRSAFDQIKAPALAKHGLRLLALLGEAEDVGRGYWVLSPHRVLELGPRRRAFIGAVPTEELSEFSAELDGLARIIHSPSCGLPAQSLTAWCRASHLATRDLSKRLLEHHVQNLQPTLALENVDYLQVSASGAALRWSQTPTAFVGSLPLMICRHRTGFGNRYFTSSISRVVGDEAPLALPLLETALCLASDSGTPLKAQVSEANGQARITLPRPLPTPIRRALLLLGRARSVSPLWLHTYISHDSADPLSSFLLAVGYHVEQDP